MTDGTHEDKSNHAASGQVDLPVMQQKNEYTNDRLEIKRIIDVTFSVTPKELAGSFCEMNGEQQAEFFNEVGRLVLSWNSPFCFQLQSILEANNIDEHGLGVMSEIGDYGKSVKAGA